MRELTKSWTDRTYPRWQRDNGNDSFWMRNGWGSNVSGRMVCGKGSDERRCGSDMEGGTLTQHKDLQQSWYRIRPHIYELRRSALVMKSELWDGGDSLRWGSYSLESHGFENCREGERFYGLISILSLPENIQALSTSITWKNFWYNETIKLDRGGGVRLSLKFLVSISVALLWQD